MISAFVTLTVFVGVSLGAPAIKCPTGWFGSKCQYMCHCMPRTPCSFRGDCEYGCDYGYFGYKCQYVDYFRSLNPNVFVDLSACDFARLVTHHFDLTHFSWARFSFERDEFPSTISIYFKADVGDPLECESYYLSHLDRNVFDFYCQPFLDIRRRVLSSTFDQIGCRMYFSRGRNLALKQLSTDAITVDGNTSNSNCLNSSDWRGSFARPSYINNVIIHTNDANAKVTFEISYRFAENSSWAQDLNSRFTQYGRVWVTNALDILALVSAIEINVGNGEMFPFCEVEVIGETKCDPFHFGLECEHVCSCPFQKKDCDGLNVCSMPCKAGLRECKYLCSSRYFNQGCATKCLSDCGTDLCHNVESSCVECTSTPRFCENDPQHRYMDLPYIANPYIIDCEHGTYGQECDLNCSVKCDNQTCDSITGRCLSCPPGWRGDYCEQGCGVQFYGPNCVLPCSPNCTYTYCNNVDGTCMECPKGRHGEFCEFECEKHSYGKNCTETCSENCVDQLCNMTDGVCLSCPVGRLGDFCDKDPSSIGANESNREEKCSSNCDRRACDPATRKCFDCVSGRVGDFCENECSNTTFGPNCQQQCDPNCVPESTEIKRLCDVITGDCLLKSKFPDDPNAEEGSDDTSGGMHLLFVLPALFIAILVIFIFIFRKMKNVLPVDVPAPNEMTKTSTSVPIANLKVYILGHTRELFLNQFNSIPIVHDGEKTEKKKAAGTYDHACINLTPWPVKSPGEFPSPSFLALAKEEIIVSQGPVVATVVGFLNLLWNKKVAKVAMVSTGKNDNEYSYWSKNDQIIDCYRVKTVNTEVFTDYTIRTLEIAKDDNPPRQLTHFQYKAWPEDGSDPCMWSLVDFEHKVFFNTLETVTLVHSGTDTTRSSVFIALHDLIRQAKLNQAVDFVDTVSRLRQDMPKTVQTFEQYMFLHHAAQAGIACTGSYTHISAIFLKVHLMGNVVNGKSNFKKEFKNLFGLEIKFKGGVGDVIQNPQSKNRFLIVPDKKYQPVLQVDSPGEGNYINAVTLPSLYTQTKQFLTQLPMPTTVNDFWRLVTQYNVSLIVAFKSYEKDKSLAIYLPEEQGQPLQCGNIAVNVESVTTAPTWTEMKLTVKGKQSQEVTHLTFTERNIEPKNLLPFVQYARSLRTPDKSVVYTCRNGAELSGLAYVVTTLMDRLDQENYLTVPVVVGKVKSIRPHAVPTLQQYILVYETMKLYTEAVISTERHRAEYSSTV